MPKLIRHFIGTALLLFLVTPAANAQYFGRNKVQWEKFDFKKIETAHFDIYYYDQEADVVHDIGRMAERWYERLSRVFNHTFTRKPIVLYANSADFQQTTTTGGLIGQGTGGFTDAFMNRVVMPLTGNHAENDHVLGHEIVHVFQYDIAAAHTSARRRFNLEQLPLWVVEGMAEYFSKGRVDPLTAMWIRDATIHDRLPDLRKLTRDPRYFPYRYGQALLAYIGGRFGDEAVVRYFLAAGTVGPEQAFERVLGLSAKQVFTDWQESARELYKPVTEARVTKPGTAVLTKKTTRGDLNVGPAISPDGRSIAFLSTRELFDIELFLADARTGEVIRRLVSADRDAHLDALRFIDSAGSWSPDSKKLAFVVFERGDNLLGIVDVETRNIERIRIPGLEAITNVAWSPDGRAVAISGQTTAATDLFVYRFDSQSISRLTNDRFADLQPAWSPDGRTIAFVTDRGTGTSLETLQFEEMTIATIDVSSGSVRVLPLFRNTKHLNPQYSPDGRWIYYIASNDGVSDVYRYSVADNRIEQVTRVQTGVAGITEMSPALSVAMRSGEIAFSVFEDDDYNVYVLPPSAPGTEIAATTVSEAPRAALLPPLRATGSAITAYLEEPTQGLPPQDVTFKSGSYIPSLKVAYVGPPSIGVGADRFGVGVGGSVSAYFSDILGQHNVGFTLAGGGGGSGGSFSDQIGGEVFYLNQKHRFNWGVDALHVPYVSIAASLTREPVTVDGRQIIADVYRELRQIQTIDDVSGVAQYPFTTTRRIEARAGIQRYGFKEEIQTYIIVGDQIIDEDLQRLPSSFDVTLAKASTAFVGDSSIFGFISPVRGTRYRYEVEVLTGDLNFQTALADWRKYLFFRPVTFATRVLHYGRYGDDAESGFLTPLYLGQGSIVRGYDPYGIGAFECNPVPGVSSCPVLNRLVGSRIGAASFEVRIPLLGTKEFGLIAAPAVPTELIAFADAGAAWRDDASVKFKFETDTAERVPVFSIGLGARILLAYIPIEIYAAKPFQRPEQDIVYGFNIIPGW